MTHPHTGGPYHPAHVLTMGEQPGHPAQFLPHPGISQRNQAALQFMTEMLYMRGTECTGSIDPDSSMPSLPEDQNIEEEAAAMAEAAFIFADAFIAASKKGKGPSDQMANALQE